MTAPREEESSWDSLADDLGLPPVTKEVSREVAKRSPQPREQSFPDEPIESPTQNVSIVEVVVPPTGETSVVVDSPGHVKVSVVVHSELHDRRDSDVVEVLDVHSNVADARNDSGYEEGDDEESSEDAPRGKKRRRRRRRGRRGSEGPENTESSENASGDEESTREGDQDEAPTPGHEEVELEDAPEFDEESDDDSEPMSAVDEEMEAEVSSPKQEWNVVSWVDLVASLHRPER